MGFFGKKHTPDSSAVTGSAIDAYENAAANTPAADIQISDPEKQPASIDNESHTALPQMHSPRVNVDLMVEARVVRKLDWRVPTLLGFLCKASFQNCKPANWRFLTEIATDLLALLDRSNIGFVYQFRHPRQETDCS